MRVFLPHFQKQRVKRLGAFEVAASYKSARIYPEQLAEAAAGAVMLFRPSMIRDMEDAGCLDGARLVYSQWVGYLQRDNMEPFLSWLTENGIPMDVVHTSGHAAVDGLRRLRAALGGAVVVPVHSEQGERFEELFGNVQRMRDGESWHVTTGRGG